MFVNRATVEPGSLQSSLCSYLLPSAARQHTILDAIRTSPLPELYNAKKISIFNRFGWMLVGLRNNYKRPLRIFKSSTSASNYCHKINIFCYFVPLWPVKRRLAIQLLSGEFINALLTFFECFTDESKVDFRIVIRDLT